MTSAMKTTQCVRFHLGWRIGVTTLLLTGVVLMLVAHESEPWWWMVFTLGVAGCCAGVRGMWGTRLEIDESQITLHRPGINDVVIPVADVRQARRSMLGVVALIDRDGRVTALPWGLESPGTIVRTIELQSRASGSIVTS